MRPIAQSLAELKATVESRPVAALARAFEQSGHELYLVGGPVRDALLGREVHDLDFTTSATPDQTRAILEGITENIWDVGRDFGTIAARVHGEQVEITTFRAERYEPLSRKPDVSFGTSVEADVMRRDFTVNALALQIPQLKLIDVSTGVDDLLAGRLRTPGSAEMSFTDDPLRIMRAARFVSQLGFEVDDDVRDAMTQFADRLHIVSAERVRDELVKLLATDNPVPGLRLLVETGVAEVVLPELSALRETQDDHGRHKDVYEHSLTVLTQAIALERERAGGDGQAEPDTVLRLAALMHDIGKPATRRFEKGGVTFHHHDVVGAKLTKKRLRDLRFDNETIKHVARLVELHLRFFGYSEQKWSDSAVRRYVRDAGGVLEQLHILTRADVTTQNRRKAERLAHAYDDIEARIAQLAEEEELASMRPELDGEAIMQLLGIGPGPLVGKAVNYLLEVRLDEGLIGTEAATQRLMQWYEAQQLRS